MTGSRGRTTNDEYWPTPGFPYYGLDEDFNVVQLEPPVDMSKIFGPHNHIKQEHVGRYFVSTVFLPIDHGWGIGDPVVFETMIFDEGEGGGHGLDEYQWRYTSYQEALKGHEQAVKFAALAANLRKVDGQWVSSASSTPPETPSSSGT